MTLLDEIKAAAALVNEMPTPVYGLLCGTNVWRALEVRLGYQRPLSECAPVLCMGPLNANALQLRHCPYIDPDVAVPCDENWEPMGKRKTPQ